MRIGHVVGPGVIRGAPNHLSMVVSASLVAAVAAACGGHQASGQVVPDRQTRLVATNSGEGLRPGDQRAPDRAPTVTTTAPQPPIGRTSSPAPLPVPVTRPPGLVVGAVTTTGTSAPVPTATMTTAPTATTTAPTTKAGQPVGSEGGAHRTDQDGPTTTTTAGMLVGRKIPGS
jgi:hypothetical protein